MKKKQNKNNNNNNNKKQQQQQQQQKKKKQQQQQKHILINTFILNEKMQLRLVCTNLKGCLWKQRTHKGTKIADSVFIKYLRVTGYWYITHLLAGFYSDVVEYRNWSQGDWVRENVISTFHILHLAPIVNNPHVCIKLLEFHFTWISDS